MGRLQEGVCHEVELRSEVVVCFDVCCVVAGLACMPCVPQRDPSAACAMNEERMC